MKTSPPQNAIATDPTYVEPDIRKPPPGIVELRKQLQEQMESGSCCLLSKDAIRQAWMQTFRMKRSNAWDLLDRVERFCHDDFLDHIEIFRSLETGNVVVTTQPYGVHGHNDGSIKRLSDIDCYIYDNSSWSWHYPGHTSLYWFELDRHSRLLLGAALRRKT